MVFRPQRVYESDPIIDALHDLYLNGVKLDFVKHNDYEL